ncbi:Serine/threonine-protein kinase KSP1 [Ceratocystis fimbriata CBS 114723]|uniref:Autophagy-related protein 1 n=1 Tax=Ceratocystis fimbriata CBS 114723 TaxID=1035309 RepID=A0A2C5W1D0_9PEZI|nr:Serine/threonine-protein kinase KSP1 [Ceratocystis fimbriata CBS 114723]
MSSCLRTSFENGAVLNGRYRTEQPLNHGSFGMVFMATDLVTNEKVAIKCMTKQSAASENDVDSQQEQVFLVDDKSEELEIHERLGRHPGIVSLLDSFETSSHLYLVIEFCERGDLYEAIRSDCGPGETEHVRKFMLQVVDAVEYMHSMGIYHRDIKPENIFITKTGAMKLGDFGLATTEELCDELAVGSDRYMAPEQYDHAGLGYSPAQSDIWSIGVCLLNILFSRNPFTRPTMDDPLFRDFAADKQSLFDVFPDMSPDTFEVICQCMSIDPSKRSLAGVRDALWRVNSFTNFDEVLDEFMFAERPAVPEANRAPLRTPSIQSPSLHGNENPFFAPVPIPEIKHKRNLSVIHDEEYDEPLFSDSEHRRDWCDVTLETPMSSMAESSMGSFQPSIVPRAIHAPVSRSTAQAGSVPIPKARAPPISNISSFGRKGASGVSWSDMVDDEDDFDFDMSFNDTSIAPYEDPDVHVDTREEMNARTFSNESVKHSSSNDEDQLNFDDISEVKPSDNSSSALSADLAAADLDAEFLDDGFFFHGSAVSEEKSSRSVPRTIPHGGAQAQIQSSLDLHSSTKANAFSGKRTLEKWEALGKRRRAFDKMEAPRARPSQKISTQNFGLSSTFSGVFGDAAANQLLPSRNNRAKPRDHFQATRPWACSSNWRENRNHFTNTWVGLDC